MNEALDQVLVIAAVAAALGFFVVRFVRSRKKGCGSGCCDVSKPRK